MSMRVNKEVTFNLFSNKDVGTKRQNSTTNINIGNALNEFGKKTQNLTSETLVTNTQLYQAQSGKGDEKIKSKETGKDEEKTKTEHQEQVAVKGSDIKDGETITVKDEIGNTIEISGQIKTEGKDEKSGFPTKITVGKYSYEFVKVDEDGKAIYKSMQGKGQTYKAEWQNDQIVLTQREGLAGTTQDGTADITSTTQKTKSTETEKTQKTGETGKTSGTKTEKTEKPKDAITTSSGRYAVKNADGSYTYYAKDGTKLNPTYARLKDPELGKLNDPRFDKDNNMKSEYPHQDELAKKHGGRKTEQAGIYYDEKKQQHFKFIKQLKDGKIYTLKVMLPNVRTVWTDYWIDNNGKEHKGRP